MGSRECVVIGYESGVKFWRRAWVTGNGSASGLLGHVCHDPELEALACGSVGFDEVGTVDAGAGASLVGRGRLSGLYGLTSPVDIVVTGAAHRRDSDDVRCHVWRYGLPTWLLAHVEDNVYVCSPELVVLQLAATRPYASLLELAYELCGDYVLLDGILHCGRHHEGTRALTTPERIAAVCACFPGARCRAVAEQLARDVLANSWSPQESQLAALMTAPRCRGGYGCGRPVLNRRIYLPDDLAALAGRGYVVPDILYPEAGTCLEYQGGVHDGMGNRKADDAKGNALLMLGISTMRVWGEQLYNLDFMDATAAHLLGELGIRRREESVKMRLRRSGLLAAFRASSRRVS